MGSTGSPRTHPWRPGRRDSYLDSASQTNPFDFGGHSRSIGSVSVTAANGLEKDVQRAYGYSSAVAYTRSGISQASYAFTKIVSTYHG
jgi:hypothetical protein